MPDAQLDLPLEPSAPGDTSLPPSALPHLRDEIARTWGLPLGEHIEVTFRPHFPLPALRGILELTTHPAYPWNPHQSLGLRIAGCDFTTRDIDHWTLLQL